MNKNQTIYSKRFILKALSSHDASKCYLSWLEDKDTAQFISYVQKDIIALSNYIEQKNNDDNCWFWGVFYQNQHIGNIKFQRLSSQPNVATMGILIGDKNWQGQGVAPEILEVSIDYLKINFSINEINLGVKKSNLSAIKAYEKIGFKVSTQGYFDFPEQSLEMIKRLS